MILLFIQPALYLFLMGRRSEGAQERERSDVIESKDVSLTKGKKMGPPLQPHITNLIT